jgi:hypothetical protein
MFPIALPDKSGGIDARSSCCEDFLWVLEQVGGSATIQCNSCGGTSRVGPGELTPALFVASRLEVSP